MLFTLVAKHLTQIEVNLFCSEPEAKSQAGDVGSERSLLISSKAGGGGGGSAALSWA